MRKFLGAACAVCLLAIPLVSCGGAEPAELKLGSAVGRDLFAEAKSRFAEIGRALADWSPDRSDWSDGYLMRPGREGPREAVLHQLRNRWLTSRADPVLMGAGRDRDGTEYTILGLEYELDDETREPHWFAVPEGCLAIYEYDPASGRLLPFGFPMYDLSQRGKPPIGDRAAPELNLSDAQREKLSLLLNEYSGRGGYLPQRIRMQLFLSSGRLPERNLLYYMDGYYLPQSSLTDYYETYVMSENGVDFHLETALFDEDGKEVQRWFILPNDGYGLYEYLPEQGRIETILFCDGAPICDFVREKAGLGEEFVFTCDGLWSGSQKEEAWFSVSAVHPETKERYSFQWYREAQRIYQSPPDEDGRLLIWEGDPHGFLKEEGAK